MSATATKKIIERIQKLLALSKDPANEHEAALAAERARALLEQHNLSMGEILEEASESAEEEVLVRGHAPKWWWLLIAACRQLYDVEAINMKGWKTKRPVAIVFCGLPVNVKVAIAAFQYLRASVGSLAARKRVVVPRWALNSYKLGAADRILDETLKLKQQASASAESQAIIRIGNAIALRHIEKFHKDGKRTSMGFSAVADAYHLGYDHGGEIDPRGAGKLLEAS